jgi:hypothetical protein
MVKNGTLKRLRRMVGVGSYRNKVHLTGSREQTNQVHIIQKMKKI